MSPQTAESDSVVSPTQLSLALLCSHTEESDSVLSPTTQSLTSRCHSCLGDRPVIVNISANSEPYAPTLKGAKQRPGGAGINTWRKRTWMDNLVLLSIKDHHVPLRQYTQGHFVKANQVYSRRSLWAESGPVFHPAFYWTIFGQGKQLAQFFFLYFANHSARKRQLQSTYSIFGLKKPREDSYRIKHVSWNMNGMAKLN